MKAHYGGCVSDETCTCQEIDDMGDETPNNRPQDGRVCNCEDAPCCGHYQL